MVGMDIDDERNIALVWPQKGIFKTIYHWPSSSPIDKSLEFLICRFINQIFCLPPETSTALFAVSSKSLCKSAIPVIDEVALAISG